MLRVIISLLLFVNFSFLHAAEKLEKVSLQLQWLDQFQFAGYYIAKEKGFYKDVGLDVELKKFNNSISPVNEIVNKKTTYGVGRSSLIIDKSNGEDITLLASIFQSSPLILLATKDSGINHIKDFKNKRIMYTPDAADTASLHAMINKYGINKSDMRVKDHTFDIDDLIDKNTDLMASYTSNEPYLLRQKGIEPIIFHPKDHGFDFYSDILFTSGDEVKNHKQRTLNFTKASLKGWKYAFDHIDETVELILKKYNSQKKSKKALIYEAKKLKELAYYNTDELGHMDIHKIQRIYDIYNVMGYVKNKIDIDKLVFHHDKYRMISLTTQEQEYLKNKKIIKICLDPNWMPFEKLDENGKHIGISSDYFEIFEKKLGIPIVPVETTSWSQTLKFAENRKCDILTLANETDKRKKYMNFTQPYLKIPFVIVTKNSVPFIESFKNLKNEKLGVVKNSSLIELLKTKYPNLNLVEVKNNKEGINKVQNNKLFGYVGNMLSIGYILKKDFIVDLKIVNKLDNETSNLAIGIRNDDKILYDIFEKMLDGINSNIHSKILNKYINIKYENSVNYKYLKEILFIVCIVILAFVYKQILLKRINFSLTNKIKKLEEQKIITILNAQPSIVILTNRNSIQGANTKFFNFFDKYKTIDEFKLDCRCICEHFQNIHPDDDSYLTNDENWLDKILDDPSKTFKVAMKKDDKIHYFIIKAGATDINGLKNIFVVVTFVDITDDKETEILLNKKTKEQDMLLSLFDKGEVCLFKWKNYENWNIEYVSQNSFAIFGYTDKELISGDIRIDDIIYKNDLDRVREEVAKAIKESVDFFVHKPYRIITKDGQIKWILDNTLIIRDNDGKVIEFLGYIVEITELKEYENSLEQLVDTKTKENMKQLEILQQQTRLAQMGEMISMIAHQWRQPLGSISSVVIGIQVDLMSGMYNFKVQKDRDEFLKFLDKKFNKINTYVQFLSATVDDFRNFFKPNKGKEMVSLTTPIKKALAIVKSSMKNKNIDVNTDFKTDDELLLYQNELMQVILNILKNSEDNFLEKKILNPKINIITKKINNKYIISISDNGGGIKEEILSKIFDPYFSTKDEKNGTGLGLYMSKIMIEEHNKGSLSVKNVDNVDCYQENCTGVCFEMIFEEIIHNIGK